MVSSSEATRPQRKCRENIMLHLATTRLAPPTHRPLRVYAFDPSRGRMLGNEMLMNVRYREVAPGPTDTSGALDQIAVIDYDASRKTYYYPVDLDDRFLLIPNGLTP